MVRYFDNSNAICSFFVTSTTSNGWKFILLIQSIMKEDEDEDQNDLSACSISSSWNSTHEGSVEFDELSNSFIYNILSSVIARSGVGISDSVMTPNWVL